MSEIGARIRAARQARSPRLTLAELAGDRLSVSLISKIERGLVQPSLATLAYLAERLDLPLGELLEGREGRQPGELALALERARLALQADDPAAALALVAELGGDEAAILRARALLTLRRDDEAAAALQPLSPRHGEAAVLRGELLARTASRDLAQDAFGRALALLGGGQSALRAEALLGLARLAEAAGQPATARNLYQQVMAELGGAASPLRRQRVLTGRADDLAAAGDALGALRAAASAAELGAIARAAALRAELAGQLGDAGRFPPPPHGGQVARFREADDSIPHRSIRPPRES